MSGGPSRSPDSVQIARRLLPPEAAAKVRDPAAAGATLQKALARVTQSLGDAMGEDGCNALLARALARNEAAHPALRQIRRLSASAIHLDGVAASVEAHGVAPVTAAIEALLTSLIDILGRLIGEEMAIRLLDPGALRPHQDEGSAP